MMKVSTRILAMVMVTGISILFSTGSHAWWNNNDDDWGGPWGYPGYGWGGYPGYGGWGGYPGWGGWGGYPGWGGWGGGAWGYPGYGWGQYPAITTQPGAGTGSTREKPVE